MEAAQAVLFRVAGVMGAVFFISMIVLVVWGTAQARRQGEIAAESTRFDTQNRGRRAIAAAIDYVLIQLVGTAVGSFLFGGASSNAILLLSEGASGAADTYMQNIQFQGLVVAVLLTLTYYVASFSLRAGTLGMSLSGLTVRDADGHKPTVEQAFKRSIFVSVFYPYALLVEGAVLAATGKSIGDRFSRTVVGLISEAPRLTQAQPDTGAAEAFEDVACPFCAESIKTAAIKCKHCGSDLPRGWAPETEANAGTTPNWYAGPFDRHEFRYWDGSEWTVHVSDAGVQSTNSLT